MEMNRAEVQLHAVLTSVLLGDDWLALPLATEPLVSIAGVDGLVKK
jgi:hypothetical protein